MKLKERKIVKGTITASGKWTTDKIHAVRVEGRKTLCGVDALNSSVLGFPQEGEIEKVNCKKCLQIIEKMRD